MGETGVKWESADGQFDVQLNGRIQLDSQVSSDQSGVHTRMLRPMGEGAGEVDVDQDIAEVEQDGADGHAGVC